MLDYLIDNKEWVFSGIGAVVVTGIFSFFSKNTNSSKMDQKSGNNSTNIQVGGNINIKTKKHK